MIWPAKFVSGRRAVALSHPAPGPFQARLTRVVRSYVVASVIVGVGSIVAEFIYRIFNTAHLSMVFLAAVLIAAVTLGAGPAIFAAFLAFVTYNFLLVEPQFTIQFAGAEDLITLIVFLSVALLTGGLAGRLRDEAERSGARARSLSVLFEAARGMSATETEEVLRRRVGEALASAVAGPALLVSASGDDGEAGVLPPEGASEAQAARERAEAGTTTGSSGRWRARRLLDGDRPLGTALWRIEDTPRTQHQDVERLCETLVDLGAAAIARARLSSEKSEAEAVARTEQLRTALLSSLSHDFRTPLAAILASATSLLDYQESFDAETRRDLHHNIKEEAERLNRFVVNVLSMIRVESGALVLEMETVSANGILAQTIDRLGHRGGAQRIVVRHVAADLAVYADPFLLEQILANLVENAIVYSPADSVIDLAVRGQDAQLEFSISDAGPGVPADELPRIFDKFYRGSNTRSAAPGTGLGLSIAKSLTEAMGGSIEARAHEAGRSGLCVSVLLPRAVR